MELIGLLRDMLAKASVHFVKARPFIPMYTHLILSALFPIYTGAHASLSRPSSAAKPDKSKKRLDSEDEDEDEDKIQKMEGMSNKDAIVLPITAGLVLASLYFLIKKYGAEMINLILGWYFSGIGVYSVVKLVNDGLNIVVSFVFPTYYAKKGSLWKVVDSERQSIRLDESEAGKTSESSSTGSTPAGPWYRSALWSVRSSLKQRFTVEAYIRNIVDLRAKASLVNLFSALCGIGTIVYVNTVSKPWFLTNLQGFAVSYSALQLMSPTTFATGSLILGSLFCYDIWAVFFTPLMVAVAKNLDQPIKLVFPRPDEPSSIPGEPPVRSFSMLGLGDIVLPGIMIGLALRFDLYMYYLKKQRKSSNGQSSTGDVPEKAPYVSPTGRWGDRFWTARLPSQSLPAHLRSSFPKPYFTASVVGYVAGMLTTLGVMSVYQHAQPALLYLVPGVLTSLWGTALVRGELKEMWDFSEAVTGEQIEEAAENEKKNVDATEEKSPKGLIERRWHEIWSSSEQKDQKKEADPNQVGQSSTSAKSTKPKETKPSKKESSKDDMLLSFSFARYNPRSKTQPKPDQANASSKSTNSQTHSPVRSESSDDAIVVLSSDLDDAKDANPGPRYRTRSARAGAVDGGVAV